MGGWSTKCFKCKKKIEFREGECDKSGFTWHYYCFCCIVCKCLLNENSVKIRGEEKNQLYCEMHKFVTKEPPINPVSKVYYMNDAYRIVF